MDRESIEKLNQNIEYLNSNLITVNNEWALEEIYARRSSLFKRLIRKLMRPMWNQQREFNKAVAAALNDIFRNQEIIIRAISEGEGFEAKPYELGSNGRPRVIQLVSSLNYGDAVGNEVIAFKRALQEAGYITEIFAGTIHKRIAPDMAKSFQRLPELKQDDIVIYHFASECAMAERIKDFPCRVILRYHNITPPKFFHGYDANAEKATANGLRQAREMRPYIDCCLPVSEFNMRDLQAMGYDCPMQVLPILLQLEDYEQEPDKAVIDKYRDGITNILFVGRMAPNKKVEDVISAFAEYKKRYDKGARLFLVGSFGEGDKYYQFLQKHIARLKVQDVIFPGHISFAEILGYYKAADLFLCMSEHEGFCVPLVEAMYFDVPIVAYVSSAITDTLGGSGVLVDNKDFGKVAEKINQVIHNRNLQEQIIAGQRRRLEDFDQDKISAQMVKFIGEKTKDIFMELADE